VPPLPATFLARARLLGSRIDTRELEKGTAVAQAPMVLPAGERGHLVVFRFGAYVAFDVDEETERAFAARLAPHVSGSLERPETETAEVVVDPEGREGVDADGRFVLAAESLERLQVVASVLAKSAVLAHHEVRVREAFDRVDLLAERLRRGARLARGRELTREIGDALLIQSRMVGRVEVSEKPEITWEVPALDRLYERLSTEYELIERERILTRKLELVALAARTTLDLVNTRQGLRVEWYIVILIVIEIAIVLYELLARSA